MKTALIICTYNRAALLHRALESLLSGGEEIPKDCEIIAVDNNSDDTTELVVSAFLTKLPLKYVLEKRQGKTHALNRGIQFVADAELIVFADDDVTFQSGWLNKFVRLVEQNPENSWFGGRVLPNWDGKRPAWIRPETWPAFRGYFIEYDLGDIDRPYCEDDALPLGASMAVRREVIDRIGGFRTDLGPRGKSRGMGDDTEYIMRAKEAGFSGRYLASPVTYHFVHPSRFHLAEYYRYGHAKGLNQSRQMILPKYFSRPSMAIVHILKAALQLLKGRGDRVRLCLINLGLTMGAWTAKRQGGN